VAVLFCRGRGQIIGHYGGSGITPGSTLCKTTLHYFLRDNSTSTFAFIACVCLCSLLLPCLACLRGLRRIKQRKLNVDLTVRNHNTCLPFTLPLPLPCPFPCFHHRTLIIAILLKISSKIRKEYCVLVIRRGKKRFVTNQENSIHITTQTPKSPPRSHLCQGQALLRHASLN
jgi:hypothetical protein